MKGFSSNYRGIILSLPEAVFLESLEGNIIDVYNQAHRFGPIYEGSKVN